MHGLEKGLVFLGQTEEANYEPTERGNQDNVPRRSFQYDEQDSQQYNKQEIWKRKDRRYENWIV
jgi:hypothetical protein